MREIPHFGSLTTGAQPFAHTEGGGGWGKGGRGSGEGGAIRNFAGWRSLEPQQPVLPVEGPRGVAWC